MLRAVTALTPSRAFGVALGAVDVRGARAAGARQQGGGRQCDQRTDSPHFVLSFFESSSASSC